MSQRPRIPRQRSGSATTVGIDELAGLRGLQLLQDYLLGFFSAEETRTTSALTENTPPPRGAVNTPPAPGNCPEEAPPVPKAPSVPEAPSVPGKCLRGSGDWNPSTCWREGGETNGRAEGGETCTGAPHS